MIRPGKHRHITDHRSARKDTGAGIFRGNELHGSGQDQKHRFRYFIMVDQQGPGIVDFVSTIEQHVDIAILNSAVISS